MSRYLIVYGTRTGNSWKIASRLCNILSGAIMINAQEINTNRNSYQNIFQEYKNCIFIASTWGDGEVQADMENLLISHKFRGLKKVIIIELGNYYGYDDFSFGAALIMKKVFQQQGIVVTDIISIDSMPMIDWETLETWAKQCV